MARREAGAHIRAQSGVPDCSHCTGSIVTLDGSSPVGIGLCTLVCSVKSGQSAALSLDGRVKDEPQYSSILTDFFQR
jgi:hypothetical protein